METFGSTWTFVVSIRSPGTFENRIMCEFYIKQFPLNFQHFFRSFDFLFVSHGTFVCSRVEISCLDRSISKSFMPINFRWTEI